jgi:hypothetical protein
MKEEILQYKEGKKNTINTIWVNTILFPSLEFSKLYLIWKQFLALI